MRQRLRSQSPINSWYFKILTLFNGDSLCPVLYFTHTLLTFWLGDHLPQYTEQLVQAIIACLLISAMAGAFWMSALAIGTSTVKQYNIIVALIDLCTVPLAYYLFTLGYNPVFAFVGKFSTMVISQLYRLYFINKKLNLTTKNLSHI